ncbi:hypothetical protein FPV67DRAFT_1618798 [Lyophyllum atratum]|nr:hypothetical protein FPV67DRAFT_1618798 [Lyophyllum atratum]
MATLSLNCLVLYHADSYVAVQIRNTERVSGLKELIKEKMGHSSDGFAAKDLQLWNVGEFKLMEDDSLSEKLDVNQLKPLRSLVKLSNVFLDVLENDDHIHVVVRPPLESIPPRILQINCLVVGEGFLDNSVILGKAFLEMFTIEIPDTKNVSALKEAIKEAQRPGLDHIRASTLSLWQVPISVDAHCAKTVADLELAEEAILSPVTPLSQLFPASLATERLHIVARSPSTPSKFKTSPPSDELGSLRTGLLRAYKPKPPSSQGKPSEFREHQTQSVVRLNCNRPPDASAPIPVTLLHSAFGQFMDDGEAYTPTAEDNAVVLKLSTVMSEIYETEGERAQKIRTALSDYGIHLTRSKMEDSAYETDGDLTADGHRPVIAEVQAEIGSSGADPYFESAFHYLESTRVSAPKLLNSVLPCMIILIFGPYIGFAGAAWSDRPNLQVLSPALPFHFHHSDTKARTMAARHLGAFKRAVQSLQKYYLEELPAINASSSSTWCVPLYPYPTHFLSLEDKSEQQFEYVSAMDAKLVFFGRLKDSGKSICIKFVRQYSKAAHMSCARLGAAPELLGFEDIPGGWHMVVMERIDSDYIDYYDFRHSSDFDAARAPLLHDEIKASVEELHQAGYVHGDMRDVNVMVARNGDGKSLLVDFDWAGIINEARYPMNVHTASDLWRPAGACDDERITAEHDIQMLEKIFRP